MILNELETKICGIPAIVKYSPPIYDRGCKWTPPGCTFNTVIICDRNGRVADWLVQKMTYDDHDKILDEIILQERGY